MSLKEDSSIQSCTERGDEEIRTKEGKLKQKFYRVLRVMKLEKITEVSKMEPLKLEPSDSAVKDSSAQVDAVTEESSSIPPDSHHENVRSLSLNSSANPSCLGNGKSLVRNDTITLRVTVFAEPDKRDSDVVEIPASCSRFHFKNSPMKYDRTSKAKSSVERLPVSHSVRKRFKCWFCPVRFNRKAGLARHIRYLHCRHTERFCELCSKQFNDPYSFFIHMDAEHREISARSPQPIEFMCELCCLKFAKVDDLNDHRCSHSSKTLPSNEALDTKPEVSGIDRHRYQCSQCSESFFLRRKFEKHIKVVHNSNSFKCSVCLRHFVCKYSYKIHVRSHFKSLTATNPFVCSQQCDGCGFWFDKLVEFYQHLDVCKSARKLSGMGG